MKFDSYVPTEILFGVGRLEELATIDLPGKKAIIMVTADGIMEKLGYQARVIQLLKKNGVQSVVYDKVQPNPTKTGVMEAAKIAKEQGCDFTIGLGGGSSIDTAKSAAIMMKNQGDLWDYATAGTGRNQPIIGAAPIVTITTTSGTGTEADPWSVITNEETEEKLDFYGRFLFPTISIIDPKLMLTVPAKLTAYQGMDALFHAIEGYIASSASPMSDMFALKAISLVSQNLAEAVNNGKNLDARENMAFAANVLAGFVQSISACTSPHIIGQTLGGMFPKLPHGASLCVIASAYYEAVVDKVPDRFTDIARAMGEDVDKLKESEKPKAFLTALVKLIESCGISIRMSDYGISKSDLPKAAQISIDCGYDLDRYTLTLQDTIDILEKSYS